MAPAQSRFGSSGHLVQHVHVSGALPARLGVFLLLVLLLIVTTRGGKRRRQQPAPHALVLALRLDLDLRLMSRLCQMLDLNLLPNLHQLPDRCLLLPDLVLEFCSIGSLQTQT
jgi:hypothetical protein